MTTRRNAGRLSRWWQANWLNFGLLAALWVGLLFGGVQLWNLAAEPHPPSAELRAAAASPVDAAAPQSPDRTTDAPAALPWPFSAEEAKMAQHAWAKHLQQTVEQENSIGMKLVLIPPGEFVMGAPDMEEGSSESERPQHRVRLTKPILIGKYEVTQADAEAMDLPNPSSHSAKGDLKDRVQGMATNQHPVERVSWYDAITFCNLLSRREKLPEYYDVKVNRPSTTPVISITGSSGYRLPTEAEWEYACRAGTTTPFHFGSSANGKEANSWGEEPYGNVEPGAWLARTCKVGMYSPNAFGLYDMHGNVWEWCQDIYDRGYYSTNERATAVDPIGPSEGIYRVYRGGSYSTFPAGARSAQRGRFSADNRGSERGFRIARTISSE